MRIGGEDECVSDRTKLGLMQSPKGSHPTAPPPQAFILAGIASERIDVRGNST